MALAMGHPGGAEDEEEHQQQQGQNPWRNEIVRTIFGDVGTIKKDFSCAVERKILLHGRMYVTDKFICFYSNLFGFEKKIKIPYSHIACVTKEYTAVFIPNAIAVITAKREYFFRSFWDRDEAFHLLKECHEQSRGGGPSRISTASRPRDRAASAGHVATVDRRDARADRLSKSPARVLSISRETGRRNTMALTPSPVPPESLTVQSSGSSDGALTGREDEEEEDKETSQRLQLDPETAFEATKEGRKYKYSAITVDFPVDLDQFFQRFLSKEAGMGLPKFHQVKGDTEVKVDDWSSNTSTDPDIRKHLRTFRFRTPIVGSPIGPPSTRGTKTQCCQVFVRKGIVVETVTHLEDIPFGDCFNVEDRWVVTPTQLADGTAGTRLEVVFEIKWMKGTWLKGTIESKTKSDMTEFFTLCTEAMATHLKTEQPPPARAEVPRQVTPAAPTTPTKFVRPPASRWETLQQKGLFFALAPWILLLFALALSVWYFRASQDRELRLLSEVHELRKLVEALAESGRRTCR
uniref:VASt domain-containing protein n=1 Tax=Rhizochromulina marina TaxID=1034831 RepID=A0A7S2STC3_9STRA|mmetsp:Transcript_6269/g.18308  ORF Transcript_6269/g.18308 Transcript_6269/m.18308 type:complete len:521 (+) Transcript_6269:232-1794(+)